MTGVQTCALPIWKMVFALPGNPAAVLVCFYKYVLPSLNKLSGRSGFPKKLSLPLAADFQYTSDRSLFLRAITDSGVVTILSGQDSDNLLSFAQANALVYLSPGSKAFSKGDYVTVLPLPH